MKVQVKILGNEFSDQERNFLVEKQNSTNIIKELKKESTGSRRQLNNP